MGDGKRLRKKLQWDGTDLWSPSADASSAPEVLKAYEPSSHRKVNKITYVPMTHLSGFSTALGNKKRDM